MVFCFCYNERLFDNYICNIYSLFENTEFIEIINEMARNLLQILLLGRKIKYY